MYVIIFSKFIKEGDIKWMDNEMNLVPTIRFKGFRDAWKQQKLGEVAEFSKGNGYSKGDLISKGTPIILYGRLYTNYKTVIENVDTFVDMKNRSVLSQGGEVIVPSSGETAEDISRASVVSKSGIILGGDLNVIKPDESIYPSFLAVTISNGKQQRELSKRAQGKSVVHINNSDLKEVILQLPSLPEQTAIGNFFRTLDDTIILHKRKLDGLKKLKKGYLQQMFPQFGKNEPRIRFDRFTGAWEIQVLGKIVDVRDGTHESPKFYQTGYPLVTSKNLTKYGLDMTDIQLISKKDFDSINLRSGVEIGDIIFAMIGTIGNPVIIDRADFAIKNVALLKNSDKLNNYFLCK